MVANSSQRWLRVAAALMLATTSVAAQSTSSAPFVPEIVKTRLPGVPEEVAARVCAAVATLRERELYKLPGVGETITWARALLALDGHGSASLDDTLGVALKVREDIDRVRRDRVLEGA